MKIAVHQMCSGIQVTINIQEITNAVRAAGAENAVMYFAPEMSVLLDRDRKRAARSIVAEKNNLCLEQLCAAAAAENIWVHLGSITVRL
jgi:deaminated glutathione amidase